MIGIMGAMHEEILELKKELINIVESNIAGMVFFEGEIHGKNVVVVESGIGKVNAAVCATILIGKFNYIWTTNPFTLATKNTFTQINW